MARFYPTIDDLAHWVVIATYPDGTPLLVAGSIRYEADEGLQVGVLLLLAHDGRSQAEVSMGGGRALFHAQNDADRMAAVGVNDDCGVVWVTARAEDTGFPGPGVQIGAHDDEAHVTIETGNDGAGAAETGISLPSRSATLHMAPAGFRVTERDESVDGLRRLLGER